MQRRANSQVVNLDLLGLYFFSLYFSVCGQRVYSTLGSIIEYNRGNCYNMFLGIMALKRCTTRILILTYKERGTIM
jgi:hypothetical protein